MNVSLLGLLSVLLITVVAGVWSAQKVSNAQDFDVGGHTFNSRLIVGALYGSFVGGTSLIGTSQLAYQLGVGAIWFTFGGAAGIALMGLLSPALGNFRRETIPQLIESSFGPQSRISTSLYMTVGMFIQVIAQVLAAIPLLESLLPVSTHTAALIAAFLILASVWAGGLWGASLVGIFKTLLMMTAFCVVGILVAGDFSRMHALQVLPARPWFNFFPHGVFTDFAAGLSVCIGTMSTQTYWQPLFAARSTRDAHWGALISAALVAFMGATATLVGMTAHMMYPGIRPIVAMPTFIQHTFPSFLGGIILGGLLLSVVMTGSGLTLGVATVLSRDIYQNLIHPNCSETRLLMVSRGIILATLATVLLVAFSNFNSLILQWAFLSMALRGVAIFLPLLRSLFGWKPASLGFATYGNYLSPLLAVGAGLFSGGRLDPLYTGLACYLLFWLLEAGAGARQRRAACRP